MELKDKVFILTGAARIGLDVAKELSGKGAKLAVTYLKTMSEVGDLKIQADVSNAADVARAVSETKAKFGRIDGLIHMAAIYPTTPWATVSEKDWDTSMDVIAKSAFLMSKAVSQQISGEGKIILISDWSVLSQPYKDHLPYNVAKSAVVGLTKSLAKELAPEITVNCIAPGPILKPPDLSETDNEEVIKNTPLGRWGGEHEISKAVLYILDADFVTGQVLYVDGGRSIA